MEQKINKINVAELLKDCPKGMELDCVMFEGTVILESINIKDDFPINIRLSNGNLECLTKTGSFIDNNLAKCVIFPKGKTSWEGFVPPCKFKDGDIVSTKNGIWIGIVKRPVSGAYETYITINGESLVYNDNIFCFERFATEEEQEKLFQAIRDNGYKWNTKTKTLEKLVEPKFKVGDKIRYKRGNRVKLNIKSININEQFYHTSDGGRVYFNYQNDWELVPNKFDIATLKPFDKVLVRDKNEQEWAISLFSHCNEFKIYPYTCINGNRFAQCIPYEGNEHLLGTTNDCDDYYKTW